MKKLLAIAMAIALTFSLAACGNSGSGTVTKDKLTVGTSADFPPYEFHMLDENGKDKIVGFDIALAQAIADEMNLTLEIKDIAFDNILLELNSGTVDLGISGFSPDPERAKAVDFSNYYYTGGQSLMIRKADADKYKGYADFNDKQFTVGAQTGSIQEALAKELTPNANYVGLQAVPSVIMELKAGKINGAFMETVVAKGYAATQDDLLVLCEVPYDVPGSAVAVKKGNKEMMEVVNKVIDKLVADGTMEKYIQEANALTSKEVTK